MNQGIYWIYTSGSPNTPCRQLVCSGHLSSPATVDVHGVLRREHINPAAFQPLEALRGLSFSLPWEAMLQFGVNSYTAQDLVSPGLTCWSFAKITFLIKLVFAKKGGSSSGLRIFDLLLPSFRNPQTFFKNPPASPAAPSCIPHSHPPASRRCGTVHKSYSGHIINIIIFSRQSLNHSVGGLQFQPSRS